VKQVLGKYDLDIKFVESLHQKDVEWCDLVISVGGDGTFLRASHSIDEMSTVPLLGINSSPSSSVGFFCAGDLEKFPSLLEGILSGHLTRRHLWRMRVAINGVIHPLMVLNECLFAASCPATTSRYVLLNGGQSQLQSSSGVWIATSAGSTGAISSAGGMVVPFDEKRLQYKVRELFLLNVQGQPAHGGFCGEDFELINRMPRGQLFLDGPHNCVDLAFGDCVRFVASRNALASYSSPQQNQKRVTLATMFPH